MGQPFFKQEARIGATESARAPAAYRAADLLKKEGAPDALLETSPGRWQATPMTPKQILDWLDRSFSQRADKANRRPGELTELLRQLRPDDVLSPVIVCAVASSKSVTGRDGLTSRDLAEAAMVAQWRTNLMWSHDTTVRTNMDRRLLPQEFDRQQRLATGRAEARFCIAEGLVPVNSSVFVFGAGDGAFVHGLLEEGVREVVAIEPAIANIASKIRDAAVREGQMLTAAEERCLRDIPPLTGEQFHENYPDRKFSVVIASNFHPYIDPGLSAEQAMAATLELMASLTRPDGTTVVGISSTDPDMVAMVSHGGVGMSSFDEVTQVTCRESPRFTDYRDVNGQVCFLKFQQPGPVEQASTNLTRNA